MGFEVREYSLTKKRLRPFREPIPAAARCVREYSLTKKRLRQETDSREVAVGQNCPGVFADEEAIETDFRQLCDERCTDRPGVFADEEAIETLMLRWESYSLAESGSIR